MSWFPVPAAGTAIRCRGLVLSCGLLAALVVAGCATGARDAPPPATAIAPVTSTAPAVEPGSGAATEAASDPPAIGSPPTASLGGTGTPPVPGELGGYTWLGAGSDAPWIVPPPAHAVRQEGPFAVTFAPALAAQRWTARWAPVVGGAIGDPAGSSSGVGDPIVFAGPIGPGTWSLQVDVRFAGDGRAVWYWRLEAAP